MKVSLAFWEVQWEEDGHAGVERESERAVVSGVWGCY